MFEKGLRKNVIEKNVVFAINKKFLSFWPSLFVVWFSSNWCFKLAHVIAQNIARPLAVSRFQFFFNLVFFLSRKFLVLV